MAHQKQLSQFVEECTKSSLRVEEFLSSGDILSAHDELQKLKKAVSEMAPNLPSYELRKAQSGLADLQSKIVKHEQESVGAKKLPFKFAKRKPPAADKPVHNITPSFKDLPINNIEKNHTPTLSGEKNNQSVILDLDKVSNRDIWLHDLENCSVVIKGVPSTLHMTQLVNCRVVGGPVLTSVFLDNCRDSKIVFGCQQLRCHKSSRCDFYLHIRSRAIIEDCSECRFAPYSRDYPGREEEFAKAELEPGINNWDQVDDFNWLSSVEPSPHWSVLKSDERLNF